MSADAGEFPVGEIPPGMGFFAPYGPPGRTAVEVVRAAAEKTAAPLRACEDIAALARMSREACTQPEARALAENVLSLLESHGVSCG